MLQCTQHTDTRAGILSSSFTVNKRPRITVAVDWAFKPPITYLSSNQRTLQTTPSASSFPSDKKAKAVYVQLSLVSGSPKTQMQSTYAEFVEPVPNEELVDM